MIDRIVAQLRAWRLDALVVAGAALVADGAWHVPAPWGDVLGPVVLGAGLIAAVRFGKA